MSIYLRTCLQIILDISRTAKTRLNYVFVKVHSYEHKRDRVEIDLLCPLSLFIRFLPKDNEQKWSEVGKQHTNIEAIC